MPAERLQEIQALLEPLLRNAQFVFSQLKQDEDQLSLEIAVMDNSAIHDFVVNSNQLSQVILTLDHIDFCGLDSTGDASTLTLQSGNSGLRYRATDPEKREKLQAFYKAISNVIQERSGRNLKR